MQVESVLSEILGVPCGNVKFTRRLSEVYVGESQVVLYDLNFTTKNPICSYEDQPVYGSISIINGWPSWDEHKYEAYLHKGKETTMLARAIADELGSE